MNVLDLFCGTGGFSKGFSNAQNCNYEIKFGIDILQNSIATFQANHRNAKAIVGDIRKVKKTDVINITKLNKNNVDIILGGPPCQGFSSIRPFRSSNDDDPRNNLFEEYASYVNYFRPKIFILENVIGLATHKNGNTLNIIQECFHKLGYDTEWKIINCAHFGIPQKRERFILVGYQKGINFNFPLPTHYYKGDTISYKNKNKVLFADNISLPKSISVMDAINDLPIIGSGEECNSYTLKAQNQYQQDRRKNIKNLTLHKSTNHSDQMLEIIKHAGKNISSIPKHLINSGYSSCYSRLNPDEPSVTITVNFVHPASNRCIHPYSHRALTPREGARLQSFDDDFIFIGNRSQITKQIGNAVPPLLGKVFAEHIKQYL